MQTQPIIETLIRALVDIGNLPLEFNTRARAMPWRDPLTEEQIWKVVERGGVHTIPEKEGKR